MADGPQFDLEEQLRRRQLQQQLPFINVDQQQQQQTTPAQAAAPPLPTQLPTQIQQPDPAQLQALQKQVAQNQAADEARMNQVIAAQPSTAQYDVRAQNLMNLGQQPDPRQYPRNKLLTALVAPLMLKQYIRNPKQAAENLDFMTRRGYGAAEQQYERTRQQDVDQFNIATAVLNQNQKNWVDSLTGAKDIMGLHTAAMNQNIAILKLPMEFQREAAVTSEALARANKLNEPTATPNQLFQASYIGSDGKMHTTNVYAKAYPGPDARVDFIGPDGRPVQNMVNRVPVPPETMSAFAVSYRAKLDKFAADPKNAGREPTPEEREKMIREAQEDPVIRRLEASQAATAKREDVRYQQQQLEKVQTRNDARIKAVLDPLDKQRQNMQMLASLTNVSDPKARQAALAITPVELISAITGMKRFNKPEVDQIINSMGGIEKFVQKIRHYIGQEGTVPSDVGNAVNKLTELMQRDLDRQQRIIDRYNTENNTINDPTRDRARAANLVDRMNRELNETPQEELKRLEEEQKRRQGAK